MLVTGTAKAEVLARLASGKVTSELPASLLLDHPSFRVLADEASADA